jgi:hypothetical protein
VFSAARLDGLACIGGEELNVSALAKGDIEDLLAEKGGRPCVEEHASAIGGDYERVLGFRRA